MIVAVCVKAAVQLRAAVIVTVASLQSSSPLQPPKLDPPVGAAVSVTCVLYV